MIIRFGLIRIGLIGWASVITLGWSVEIAHAQIIVTITNTGYVAANRNNPPKADPQGTWSVPTNSGTSRVQFEYGTVTNGVFALNNTIGSGGTVNGTVNKTNGNWGRSGWKL